jgi:DNA helicase-2/ATP-dependent DNA helicase PcrA
MKERVARLAGEGEEAEGLRIGTFHALLSADPAARGGARGLPAGFQIYDTADQLGIVRSVLKNLGSTRPR